MKFQSSSPAETKKIAADFAKKIVSQIKTRPLKVGLFGDLGAGKTTFVQGMARGCGIDPDYYVNSPTFTLINEYVGATGRSPVHIVHVDLYRIEKSVDVMTLALEESFQPGNLIVVEWPEKWPELIQDLNFQIRFETVSDKVRNIEIIG